MELLRHSLARRLWPAAARALICMPWLVVASAATAVASVPPAAFPAPARAWTPPEVLRFARDPRRTSAQMVPDRRGGGFVAWEDYASGIPVVRVTRIAAAGTPVAPWPAEGTLAAAAARPQLAPSLSADDQGGVYVVWRDEDGAGSMIRAQHLDANGACTWPAEGWAAGEQATDRSEPAVVASGSGCFLAWEERASDMHTVHVLRLNEAGVGVHVRVARVKTMGAGIAQCLPRLTATPEGGVLVAWNDVEEAGAVLRVQCLTERGAIAESWPPDGARAGGRSRRAAAVIDDGNSGAFLAWEDHRGADGDIAGGGGCGFGGDGGLAIYVPGVNVSALAVDRDGVVYYTHGCGGNGSVVIRRVGLDGIISTVAGAYPHTSGSAVSTFLNGAPYLSFSPEGYLQFRSGGAILRIQPPAPGRRPHLAIRLRRLRPAGDRDRSAQPPAEYRYDAADRLLRQTLPGARTIGFTYDANGNLTTLTPPGRPAHGFEYTPVDQSSRYAPPAAGLSDYLTRYVYDRERALTHVKRPDSLNVTLNYDVAGRLASVTTPRGVHTLSYSPTTGNLTSVTSPDTVTVSYDYDGALPTTETWTGKVIGTVSHGYDNNLRVTSQTVNGNTVSFGYDNDGLLTTAGALAINRSAANGLVTGTTLGGVTTSQSYSHAGELWLYEAKYGSTVLLRQQYDRDSLGRIVRITETEGATTKIKDYEYWPEGWLKRAVEDGVQVGYWVYEANGNRIYAEGAAGADTASADYDAQDRLLRYRDTRYQWAANGELAQTITGADTTRYAYDALGNLVRVHQPGGEVLEYLIDGQNRRVGRKLNGVLTNGWLYQNGLNPVAELDGAGAVVNRYVYGTRGHVPEYLVRGGVTYRIVPPPHSHME